MSEPGEDRIAVKPGSACSLRSGFGINAHISAASPPVKDFSGYYLNNRAPDDWCIAFYEKLRKRMQRRILELMIQNRLPKGNSYDLSVKWQANWINGLWNVISVLNPFRPQYWVILFFISRQVGT